MTENKKIRSGVVVSDKMDKSIVVKIETIVKHPLYKRTIRRSKKFKVHDEQNRAHTGDHVSIIECRPISKTKTWRLLSIKDKTMGVA
jgi:small subunit ribosomal protein S17